LGGNPGFGSTGMDNVRFLLSANAGEAPGRISRIASGGELSRIMLALKNVFAQRDQVPSMVFDEVDAGVGGATAVALASVLARLAQTHQVIVVTHLAQVAVHGTRHYLVRKSADQGEDGLPQTTIVPIEGEDRVAEIARMLSGDTGELARAHARDMLSAVQEN
jgi:DNA repair protein RecN (Recombination protein N)